MDIFKPVDLLKRIAAVVLILAAVFAVLALWHLINLGVAARENAVIAAKLAPMLDAGAIFVGVELGAPENDKLVAFSPHTKDVVTLCTLSKEVVAAASPDKTKLFFLKKQEKMKFPENLFNHSQYKARLMLLSGPERRIRIVSRGFDGVPLSVGYGVTGIWGGSNDRVYFTMIRKPDLFDDAANIPLLGGLKRAFFSHNVYYVDGEKAGSITKLPSVKNIRDVLFMPGETWYATAYWNEQNQHLLGMMTDKRNIAVELVLAEKPKGLFDLPGPEIGIIAEDAQSMEFVGAIIAVDEDGENIRLRLETPVNIRRARIDTLNGYLFFIQTESYRPSPDEDYPEPPPTFRYALYSISLDRIAGDEPLTMDDLTHVTKLRRGGNMGFYDLDIRAKKVVVKDSGKFIEMDYDGGNRREIWFPEGARLQWIQILYGD